MGIFSRLTDIVNANLNSLLDKAEDPPKMVRLIIQEMEEGLVRERSNLARYLADKKELRRQQDRNQHQLDDWQSKAELALQKGRDDLARMALIEKGKQQQLVDALAQEFAAVAEGIAKLTAEIEMLETKLEDARARQKAMLLRSAAAQSRLNVQQHGQRATPHSILEKFDRMERKIEEMESKADVYHPNPNLQQQFAELEVDDAISRELAAMKERMQSSAAKEE
jgi:phage shock protein A